MNVKIKKHKTLKLLKLLFKLSLIAGDTKTVILENVGSA